MVSDFSKFYSVVETLKKILYKYAYSMKFVDKCILKFLNNIVVERPVVITVPKLEL